MFHVTGRRPVSGGVFIAGRETIAVRVERDGEGHTGFVSVCLVQHPHPLSLQPLQ